MLALCFFKNRYPKAVQWTRSRFECHWSWIWGQICWRMAQSAQQETFENVRLCLALSRQVNPLWKYKFLFLIGIFTLAIPSLIQNLWSLTKRSISQSLMICMNQSHREGFVWPEALPKSSLFHQGMSPCLLFHNDLAMKDCFSVYAG